MSIDLHYLYRGQSGVAFPYVVSLTDIDYIVMEILSVVASVDVLPATREDMVGLSRSK